MMLDRIRGLAYRLGFRPKIGSIFFSPSLDLLMKTKEAFEYFNYHTVSGLDSALSIRIKKLQETIQNLEDDVRTVEAENSTLKELIDRINEGVQDRVVCWNIDENVPAECGHKKCQLTVEQFTQKRIAVGCPNCGGPWSEEDIEQDRPRMGWSCSICNEEGRAGE